MDQLCTACCQKLRPPSSVLLTATANYQAKISTTASFEALQLQPFPRDLETEYKTPQTTPSSQNMKEFHSGCEWLSFPTSVDTWLMPAPFPTSSGYCLDGPPLPQIGFVDTSEPSSHATNRSENANSGDYRCYRHGCEGRRFSSSENYRRHIRERSQSDRTSCPFCATVFTRKSNRDTHIRKGRCKALNNWSCGQGNVFANGESLLEGTYEGSNVEQFRL